MLRLSHKIRDVWQSVCSDHCLSCWAVQVHCLPVLPPSVCLIHLWILQALKSRDHLFTVCLYSAHHNRSLAFRYYSIQINKTWYIIINRKLTLWCISFLSLSSFLYNLNNQSYLRQSILTKRDNAKSEWNRGEHGSKTRICTDGCLLPLKMIKVLALLYNIN